MKRSSLVTVPVVALIVLLVVVGCSPTLLTTAPLTSLIPGRENQAAFFAGNASPVTSSKQSTDQATSGLEETAEAIENPENAAANAAAFAAAASGGAQEPNSLQPPVVGQGGTCISGSIIDVYHQLHGTSDWKIFIEKISPDQQQPIAVLPNSSGYFQYPTSGNSPLSAGTYRVNLNFPEGWQPFTPTAFEVTLNGTGTECAQIRFKMEALAALEVIKLDNHGYMDFRERIGIPGWEITIRAVGQDTTLTAVTDGEGKAYFRNLPPGEWVVSEEEKVGWQPAAGYPAETTITLISPKDPGTFQSLVFINEQVHNGTIAVTKKDIWQQPLPGWTITLSRPDGTQPMQTAVTGADGMAYFQDLALGEWLVTETSQPWWQPVSPIAQTVLLDVPGSVEPVLFTNEPLGCVDGYKINHFEQGLSSWEIRARNSDTGEEFSAITDETGYFFFHLPLGTWNLSEIIQEGWTAVTASEFPVAVNQPFTCEHVRFKNRTDYACADVYKKDAFDNSGLPGWHITLQPAYGGVAQSGITDGTGWVRFNMLTPGTYTISEVGQSGWVSVGPQAATLDLENNGTCAVITFYNRQTGTTPVTLPATTPEPEPASTESSSPCSEYYTVKRGDTLYGIARRFNMSWDEIEQVNELANPRVIHVGNVLCIP